MIHTYTRDPVGNDWDIPHEKTIGANGEPSPLLDQVMALFPGKTISINGNLSSLNINITPDLTGPEITSLNNLIISHKSDATKPLPDPNKKEMVITGNSNILLRERPFTTAILRLQADATINILGIPQTGIVIVYLIQDATGGRNVTWGANIETSANYKNILTPKQSSGSNKKDVYYFVFYASQGTRKATLFDWELDVT